LGRISEQLILHQHIDEADEIFSVRQCGFVVSTTGFGDDQIISGWDHIPPEIGGDGESCYEYDALGHGM
jgi:hypothetical protein